MTLEVANLRDELVVDARVTVRRTPSTALAAGFLGSGRQQFVHESRVSLPTLGLSMRGDRSGWTVYDRQNEVVLDSGFTSASLEWVGVMLGVIHRRAKTSLETAIIEQPYGLVAEIHAFFWRPPSRYDEGLRYYQTLASPQDSLLIAQSSQDSFDIAPQSLPVSIHVRLEEVLAGESSPPSRMSFTLAPEQGSTSFGAKFCKKAGFKNLQIHTLWSSLSKRMNGRVRRLPGTLVLCLSKTTGAHCCRWTG